MQKRIWRELLAINTKQVFLSCLLLVALLLSSSVPVQARAVAEAVQQSTICTWYGAVYYPGQIVSDIAGQQYLCNADGTFSYIGLEPTYPSYPNPYPYPYPFDYNVGYTHNVLTGYLYSAYSLPNYQFPYVPTNPFPADSPEMAVENSAGVPAQLEYFEQTCIWNGTVFKPGQKFCNNACQEFICNSNGSIVWTGMVRNVTCPTCINTIEPE